MNKFSVIIIFLMIFCLVSTNVYTSGEQAKKTALLLKANPKKQSFDSFREDLPKPAVLFCSPNGANNLSGWVDLDYLKELHDKGFQVDYTKNLGELAWDRIKNYNVLVLFVTPHTHEVLVHGAKFEKVYDTSFRKLMEQYLNTGGGIFLFPREKNIIRQRLFELTEAWGVKLPTELIVESDPKKNSSLSRMPAHIKASYTANILPSPVTEGVTELWYPNIPIFRIATTIPIMVDKNWLVVVRASGTSVTEARNPTEMRYEPTKEHFFREKPEKAPAIMAVRNWGPGRIAMLAQWNQFSFGSGTKWLYNREILDKGLKGKKSDMWKLLENTFQWLGEPSLVSGKPGGYKTDVDQVLVGKNHRKEYQEKYIKNSARNYWKWLTAPVAPYLGMKVFKGIIGAKSSYSTGKGTVNEYAKAARKANLDFVVFAEDFAKLTPKKFEKLKKDCQDNSGSDLLLLPGYTIQANIGNHVLHFGPNPALPPARCLCGPGKKQLFIQGQDNSGVFTGKRTDYLAWVLANYSHGSKEKGNVCYYNFKGSGKGMRMPDLRLYSMAALRYYKNGKLIEDVTDEYMTTAHCTIPPMPVSFNEVTSPRALINEVNNGHALTYAASHNVSSIYRDSLLWARPYSSRSVFPSDGPIILSSPYSYRVDILGAECFVPVSSRPAVISVKSDKGLKEVSVFNGEKLFRRFLCKGKKKFDLKLILDGTVQKNLFLVVKDKNNKKAVSFTGRTWKADLGIDFCGDHINNGRMLMAHGPLHLKIGRNPGLPLDHAGASWDGGPTGILPLMTGSSSIPILQTSAGNENGGRTNQTTILEFTDEGASAVASRHKQLFDPTMKNVGTPWNTFGPLGGPTQLMEYTQRVREWHQATVNIPRSGWSAPQVPAGVRPGLFINNITFKKKFTIKNLKLGYFNRLGKEPAYIFAIKTEGKIKTFNSPSKTREMLVEKGDWFGWFGLYPEVPSNSALFINRGDSIRVRIALSGNRILLSADMKSRSVKKGDTFNFELFHLMFPLDIPINRLNDLTRYVDYLEKPDGLKIICGKRLNEPGHVEIAPNKYMVELKIPRPKAELGLVLPVRIKGLNPRWSAGLWLKKGYVKGIYGTGENRYRALGMDFFGNAYIPINVDRGEVQETHLVAGHPVIADRKGKDLFIQVTRLKENPFKWHLSVNNPMNNPVTTTLSRLISLPDMKFKEKTLTIPAGGYLVLEGDEETNESP